MIALVLGGCTSPSRSSPDTSRPSEVVGGAISKRRAMNFTFRFLGWWQFHPDRAERAAGSLPTRQLFPGHFMISWAEPVREGVQWKVAALAVKRGRPLALRELTLLFGRSPEGDISVQALAKKPEEFASLNEVVELLDTYLDVPIVLPAVRQARFDLASSSVHLGPPGAQGYLAWGWEDGRRLLVTYGSASLSNCGGGTPERVKIAGVTGLAVEPAYNTAVIWPASQNLPSGSYGLSGDWSLNRLVEWATGMQNQITDELEEAPPSGC
jgi:hypothetical protein